MPLLIMSHSYFVIFHQKFCQKHHNHTITKKLNKNPKKEVEKRNKITSITTIYNYYEILRHFYQNLKKKKTKKKEAKIFNVHLIMIIN